MSTGATTRHSGRRLTGLTFGRRGASPTPYCRIYDKTAQADPDAPIRQVWDGAGYRDGEGTVWRVEFELRSEFLRNLNVDGDRLSSDPAEFLAHHLDETWRYLLTRWLVFRSSPDERTRIERTPPAPWWNALAATSGLNGSVFGPVRELKRAGVAPRDAAAQLRQATGLLVSVAALNGTSSLDDTLAAFGRFAREVVGEQGFAEQVVARCHAWGLDVPFPKRDETAATPPDRVRRRTRRRRKRKGASGRRGRD